MAHRSLYSGSRVSAAVKRRKAKTDLSAADLSHGGLLRCESVFRRIGSSTRTTRPMGRRDGWLWSTLGGSIWRICGAEPLRGSRQCCIGIRASIRLLPLPWLLAAHRTCHLEKFCGLQPDRARAASSDPDLCGGVWRWRAVQLLAAERHNAWKGVAYNALSQAGIGCAYNIVSEFSLDILQEFGIKTHVKATA